MNKKCQAISNKKCNKEGFQLCSSSVIKFSKDCGCVYVKKEKKLDRLGKSDRDIKYAISLVKQDPRCPSTHPYRSNLLRDLDNTNDIQTGSKCFNKAACGASKRSYYKQLRSGFKCNYIDIKNLNENKKIKKVISKLQQERILIDYKISKNKNIKDDLSTISKENMQLLNILKDDLNFKKKEVKDVNKYIENKKKQIKNLESIKKTHIKSLLNLKGENKKEKIIVIEKLDVKINDNKESLKELENNLEKKIVNIFNLTEKILVTRKNAINSKNKEIIMKANIKKDKKIKDANKYKEDYLRFKFTAKKNYKLSLKINEKIEYLESLVKRNKKKLSSTKDSKEKDIYKNSVKFLQKEIDGLEEELFLIKKEDLLLKKKLDLVEKKRDINIKEASIIKKDTQLKNDETKIKMIKKENVNTFKLQNIINNKKDILKDKKKIIESKLKIIKSNNKINKKNEKLILEKKINVQNKIIGVRTRKNKVDTFLEKFYKLKKDEKIAEDKLKKIRKMLSKFNYDVENKSSESKEMIKKSKKLTNDIETLNNEIIKNNLENKKLKTEIKKSKKEIKKDEGDLSFYSKTLKSIKKNTIFQKVTKHYKKNPKPYILFFIFFIFMAWVLTIKKDENEVLSELLQN